MHWQPKLVDLLPRRRRLRWLCCRVRWDRLLIYKVRRRLRFTQFRLELELLVDCCELVIQLRLVDLLVQRVVPRQRLVDFVGVLQQVCHIVHRVLDVVDVHFLHLSLESCRRALHRVYHVNCSLHILRGKGSLLHVPYNARELIALTLVHSFLFENLQRALLDAVLSWSCPRGLELILEVEELLVKRLNLLVEHRSSLVCCLCCFAQGRRWGRLLLASKKTLHSKFLFLSLVVLNMQGNVKR
mmetsp:Transcript_128100/g.190890  ORF Transcript_128100/g.190890 Transcript_128100/m.190890 type:complete len:242 (+) Transcript_128100:101-826(+)